MRPRRPQPLAWPPRQRQLLLREQYRHGVPPRVARDYEAARSAASAGPAGPTAGREANSQKLRKRMRAMWMPPQLRRS